MENQSIRASNPDKKPRYKLKTRQEPCGQNSPELLRAPGKRHQQKPNISEPNRGQKGRNIRNQHRPQSTHRQTRHTQGTKR